MKKIFVLIALTLAFSLLLCACSKRPEGPAEESESETSTDGGVSGLVGGFLTKNVRVSGSVGHWDENLRVRLFYSHKQYKTYEENYFLDQEVQMPGDADIFGEKFVEFPEVLAKYDEEFFESSYLVLIHVIEEYETVRHRIENVEVRDVQGEPKLCVDIKRLTQPIDSPVNAYWYLFVEVDRGDLVVNSSYDVHVTMED